jgi:hypothetical protein
MDHDAVAAQIRAALKMLRLAIEACPDSLWNRASDHNPFWVLAHHALYFAHLYLSPSENAFEAFERNVEGRPGFGRTDLGDWIELISGDVYSRDDVLAYCDHIDQKVSGLVGATPFDEPSGFHWLPLSRGEAHLYNLRHIQHRAGQLIERLRQSTGEGSGWVFSVR